jgi:proline iminopeptidase
MAEEAGIITTDDGALLWTVRSGSPQQVPFVLCHGGPGLWDQLAAVSSLVDDLAWVIRWDQRGAGRSQAVGPYSIGRSVADLECLRASLGVERWIVGGHSWGAALALRYALRHPDRVLGLVYLSGTDLGWPTYRDNYRAERIRRLGRDLPRWQELNDRAERSADEDRELAALNFSTEFADRDHPSELYDQWGYRHFEMNAEANAAITAETDSESQDDLRTACSRFTQPVLVLHGDRDPRPTDGPRDLAGVLPNARLGILQEVGHVPWAERPEQLDHQLRPFVTSLSPGAS